MKLRSLNWPIWLGFLLALFAFISYLFIFVRSPITRDFPWVNLLLFAGAAALLIGGLRRSFGPGGTRGSKIKASIVAALSVLIIALFVFTFFVGGKMLPASHGAPHVGQKAPEFRLADSNGKTVALSELLATPVNGKSPKGVLLVFYRGYW